MSNKTPVTLRMSDREHTITIHAADADAGGPPKIAIVAYSGGPINVGWGLPVVVDLQGVKLAKDSLPIRSDHNSGTGIGHTTRVDITKSAIKAEGVISRATPEAKEFVASAKQGFPWQASIGASVIEHEVVREGEKAKINGKTFKGPFYWIRASELYEVSLVDLGADRSTSVTVAAKGEEAMPKEIETVTAGKDDQKKVKAKEENVVEKLRTEAAAEVQRIAAIQKVCESHPEIAAKAIEEGWSAQRAELEVLRASRPSGPAVHVKSYDDITGTVLEAACAITAGIRSLEKHYDEKTLEAADQKFRGGIGLQELLLHAAWANGYTGRTARDLRSVLEHAFRPTVSAGFSTVDIGGILSNVSNKFLLEGFYAVERTWRNICATRNVNDFKTITSYRLIGSDQYAQVAPGGELKHGTLGEETFTNKADTYGLILSIDRRDIVNDDLGAITNVPRKLGRGAGLKINDVFWSVFMNNASFFSAGNNNYLTGASSALGLDGLTGAEAAFMDQVDEDGKPIGVMPAIMLVPTALSALGAQLYNSTEIRDSGSSGKYPVSNPHQGKFRVEVSRYLSNTQYSGNSAKAWYLLADPNDLAVIEVAFLNGRESPTIETADADFSSLGVRMRGYHDFGVALQDPKGGVKSKGEA